MAIAQPIRDVHAVIKSHALAPLPSAIPLDRFALRASTNLPLLTRYAIRLNQDASFTTMAIPTEFSDLIEKLNQELAQTEQEATTGLNLLGELL